MEIHKTYATIGIVASISLIIIIFFAVLENLWPLIIGYSQTPKGVIFLGTVHHPADYFYYVSQFTQGAYKTLTTIDLYTSEHISPSLIGWSNVLLGKIFFLLGFSPIPAYHISVGIFTIILFFCAYLLCLHVFKSRLFATLALYLFTLFHAFPMLRDNKPSYGDYWNNFAVPRVRIGAVPHQLIIATTSFLLVLGAFQWAQNKRSKKTLILIAFSSMILGSLQPALWALTTGALLMSYILTIHKAHHMHIRDTIMGVCAMGSGVLPVIYITKLFQSLPFIQLRLWEATQQTLLTPEHFLIATGPVFLMALISIPVVLSRITFERVFLVIFSITSITLLLSPVPALLGVSHVRFMSTLTILSLALLAVYGIMPILQTKRTWPTTAAITLLVMLSFLLIPNHMKTIALSSAFASNNLYHYLPVKDYELFRSIASMSPPTDTFLVIQPYNELFPALSGRRSYNGHPLLTIKATEKDTQAALFFSNTWESEAMLKFLQIHHISWVIGTPKQDWLKTAKWAFVRAKTDNLILYEIQK